MHIKNRWLVLFLLFLCGCSGSGGIDNESSDKEYVRGVQLLHEGRDSEALGQFLGVIRRYETSPRSHLCAGRIYLEVYNDPVYAIYHFREFLLQSIDAREKAIVTQLIDTAKKKFIKDMPGSNSSLDPNLDIIDVAKRLREENVSLRGMVKELRERCSALESKKSTVYRAVASEQRSPVVGKRKYVVQPGDTLSTISKKYYGSANFWKKIFEANQDQIPYPNALTVGQEIIIP